MSIGIVTGWQRDDSGFRVYVYMPEVMQDADGSPMNHIHFNFTHEGLITDVVDDDGEIVETSSETYYEMLDRIGYALSEEK